MPTADDQDPLERLSHRFTRFTGECQASASPLYEWLSLGVAGDAEILALAATAPRRPVPNLLFASVHFLLMKSGIEPLVAFYPDLCPTPRPAEEAYPYFRQFCLDHREEIQHLLSTRLVQTNEVRRSACLLPAFDIVARRSQGLPLALVEIGASAGLNLLWDQYSYDYGNGGCYGDSGSSVSIRCTPRGRIRPPLPSPLPSVAFRVGLDLEPIDVQDAEATAWLRALIWPEHEERADLLERALAVAQQAPPPLVRGDAVRLLPEILATVPEESALCLYHSHTLNQLGPKAREHLSAVVAGHAARRDLAVISLEGRGDTHALLELAQYKAGVRTERMLARCCVHGSWIEWLQDGTITDE